MSDNYFFALLITIALSFFFQSHFRNVALKIGLIDVPSQRKQHQGDVPLTGGIAIFLAFSFSVLFLVDSIHHIRVLCAGALILMVVGVLDDLHEIKASHRFYMQAIVAFVIFQFQGIQLLDFGELLIKGNTLSLGDFSLPFTVIGVIAVINAFNMLDGVDGLAGSVACIILFTLSMMALSHGDSSSFQILGLLTTSTFVFVLFNWRFFRHKNTKVFMGDAGTLFIGYILAYFLIKLSQGENRVMPPIAALWIFGYPIIDTTTMILRRLIKGGSPFNADREHFHHLLQLAGFSGHTTTFIILLINILFVGIGVAIERFDLVESYAFYVFLICFLCYFYVIMRAWKIQRFLKRQLAKITP